MSFSHAEGNVDLYLRDALEDVLVSATSATDDEALPGFAAPVTGTYFIHVELTSDSGSVEGTPYDLDIIVDPAGGPGGCLTDPLEPNDTFLDAEQLWHSTWVDLSLCEDDDWFSMDLTVPDGLTFEVSYDASEGEVSAELYSPLGLLLGTYPGYNGSLGISHTATTDGLHGIRLILAQDLGPVGGTTYDVSTTIGPGCPTDPLEPNSQAAPADIPAYNGLEELWACLAGDDWYALSLEAGDQLGFTVDFDSSEGDIDIFLTDPSGATVASSQTSAASESINHTATQSGDYGLGVVLVTDSGALAGADYTLGLDLDPAVPSCAAGDALEEDDFSHTATFTNDLLVTGLSSCPSDDDWFEIDSSGAPIEIDVVFNHGEGNIDLFLLDASLNVVTSSTSTSNNESIHSTPGAGTWYLKVSLVNDLGSATGNSYDLDLIAD